MKLSPALLPFLAILLYKRAGTYTCTGKSILFNVKMANLKEEWKHIRAKKVEKCPDV